MLARQRQEVILERGPEDDRRGAGVGAGRAARRLRHDGPARHRGARRARAASGGCRWGDGRRAAAWTSRGSRPSRPRTAAAKKAIAAAAVQLLEPGASVALSAGTTTARGGGGGCSGIPRTHRRHQLAARWPRCCTRGAGDDLMVVLTGGEARAHRTRSWARWRWRRCGGLHVDWLLMGVHGMDAEAGFTTPNLAGGRDEPGAGRGARGAWPSWPTTPSGAWWDRARSPR